MNRAAGLEDISRAGLPNKHGSGKSNRVGRDNPVCSSRHNVSRHDIDKARSFIGSHKKELR